MNIKLPAILLAVLLFAGLPLASSNAYVGISVAIAPPAIPVYVQPYCPAPGYIWTPGYWAYDGFDYYWVPGVWVAPPRVGYLWTPGYWGYNNGLYAFNDGYWGPTVGFYGGINYGFGYGGRGYYGGQWVGETFRYNTAVTRVNPAVITNTYVNREVVKNTGSRAGFNGPGGAKAKATAQEQAAAKAEHLQPTSEQRSRVDAAKNNPDLHAKNNHGKPKAAAINALDGKNGQQPAEVAAGSKAAAANETRAEKRAGATKQADAARQAGSEKRAGAAKHIGAEKATDRAVKATDRPTAKAHRTAEASAPHARKAAPPSHKAEVRKVSSAPRAVRHAPTMSHRPQPIRSRQAAPVQHGRSPAAQGPQDSKKKKKNPREKPNGG